ncbi:MAG: transposase [Sedimentisphaerales bacterium]|nr:transposase [Sedimentisphaerales bacterium]
MITFTTYGSWLPGDKRRYVQQGKVLHGNEKIYEHARKIQKTETIKLNAKEKAIVRQAIIEEAEKVGQKLEAIAVYSNHVHLVVRWSYHPIGDVVSRYKNAAMFALGSNGRTGRIWTRGYDRRFCFTEDELNARIQYVKRHED